jgi:ssDNA-binding replication factor A large subunit
MVFSIMDKSNECINVNVWGELSELQINEGDILAINGARVSNFGGKSLNVS